MDGWKRGGKTAARAPVNTQSKKTTASPPLALPPPPPPLWRCPANFLFRAIPLLLILSLSVVVVVVKVPDDTLVVVVVVVMAVLRVVVDVVVVVIIVVKVAVAAVAPPPPSPPAPPDVDIITVGRIRVGGREGLLLLLPPAPWCSSSSTMTRSSVRVILACVSCSIVLIVCV